jgi:hypothetical protein
MSCARHDRTDAADLQHLRDFARLVEQELARTSQGQEFAFVGPQVSV